VPIVRVGAAPKTPRPCCNPLRTAVAELSLLHPPDRPNVTGSSAQSGASASSSLAPSASNVPSSVGCSWKAETSKSITQCIHCHSVSLIMNLSRRLHSLSTSPPVSSLLSFETPNSNLNRTQFQKKPRRNFASIGNVVDRHVSADALHETSVLRRCSDDAGTRFHHPNEVPNPLFAPLCCISALVKVFSVEICYRSDHLGRSCARVCPS